MSHDSFFKRAREIHDRIYPPSNTDAVSSESDLALAAAFEGMHRWEHGNRQKGDPMKRGAAIMSLTGIAKDEAIRLYNAETSGGLDSSEQRDTIAIIAEDKARTLYDAHYGRAEVYDPGQVAAHDTMSGEWSAWCGDDEYRTVDGLGHINDDMDEPFWA